MAMSKEQFEEWCDPRGWPQWTVERKALHRLYNVLRRLGLAK